MADEGSSSHEVCLSESSWVFLNSDVDNSSGSGNSPSGNSDKTTPPSSTVSTPTAAGTETKEPPPAANPSRASSKRRGRGGSEMGGKSDSTKDGGGSDEAAGGAEHDIHILTERERRKKMRDMFANLHALLPQLPQKADKSSIVDEAVRYIKKLQGDLQRLEQRKLERLQNTTTPNPLSASSNSLIPYNNANTVTREAFLADLVSSSNNINDGCFIPSANSSLNASPISKFPVAFQIWTSSNVVLTVCGVEAQFNIVSAKKFGVLSAIFFVLDKYNIDVMAASISSLPDNNTNYMIQAQVRGAHHQSLELFSVEDIYRQAAGEIMEWISSWRQ